jgi:hypothetical protein
MLVPDAEVKKNPKRERLLSKSMTVIDGPQCLFVQKVEAV